MNMTIRDRFCASAAPWIPYPAIASIVSLSFTMVSSSLPCIVEIIGIPESLFTAVSKAIRERANERFVGVAEQITDQGALVVRDEDGNAMIMDSGEISLRFTS
ncbi:MAG: hypothetical protein E7599_07255 [Ruminococcaceae bacterium]|nr:hypothetical protein [Oscillospiraceae bacterium]